MTPFAPVHLAEPLGDRGSQTFLRHYSLCPRSGFLYAKHRGEASTAQMQRGTAFHEVANRATRAMISNREPVIPPELAKAIVNEVLAEVPVPFEEHDYIRECAYRWASEFTIDPTPGTVKASETLFVLELDGFQVRARVDFAQLIEGGRAMHLIDYKTARAAPAQEEIARRRADGTLAAKSFQLVLYALAVAFGVPIRTEREAKQGIPAPSGVAPRARRFDLEFVYPGIENGDGRMLRRTMSLTRPELDEYRESLRGLVARLRRSEESGDWPAVVSDEACGICPSASECPIPKELRAFRGAIETVEQAAETAAVLDRMNAEAATIRKAVKAFCKTNDVALRFGGKVWEFVPVTRTSVDREALIVAAERAAGESFDRARYEKVSSGTDFKSRDLTEDEKAEGSNG